MPNILNFDPENLILVVDCATDFDDLSNYYQQEHQFPIELAISIGQL